MVDAFIVREASGALELNKDLTMPKLKNDEVLIRHTALGLNHFDIEAIRGYHGVKLPFVPGIEVVGVIEDLGLAARQRLSVNNRVAYFSLGTGGFAEKSIVNMKHVVRVPGFIEDSMAAAGLLKTVLAIILLTKAFRAYEGAHVLIFGPAGGVGHILAQLAKWNKCCVIGVTSSKSRHIDNCDVVLHCDDDDFYRKISNITGGCGVNVVYDPIVSKTTLKMAERALDMFGIYILYGQISAEEPKIAIKNLRLKSLYVTRPSLFHYCAASLTNQMMSVAAFDLMKRNIIVPKINKAYEFKDIPKACKALAEGKLKGSNIITF